MTAKLTVMSLDAGLVRRFPAAASELVREHQPDLVALTGAPRYQRWRSKRAAIARRLGLVVTTADRVGGMFVATTLRVDVKETSFSLSSSSAGSSPAVICVGFAVRGERWRLVLAATGGAAEYAARDVPTVVVGGVGGPNGISADRSITVESCAPLSLPGQPGASAMIAVLSR